MIPYNQIETNKMKHRKSRENFLKVGTSMKAQWKRYEARP